MPLDSGERTGVKQSLRPKAVAVSSVSLGTLGYNWQATSWVFGLETDYSWANISGSSSTCGITLPHNCGTKLELLGTFRGCIGYALGPTGTWLPYITGGLAVGDVQAWDVLTPSSGQAFRAGWTVGAGIETLLGLNWTAKVEYLYMDLGSAQLFDVFPVLPKRSASEPIWFVVA